MQIIIDIKDEQTTLDAFSKNYGIEVDEGKLEEILKRFIISNIEDYKRRMISVDEKTKESDIFNYE